MTGDGTWLIDLPRGIEAGQYLDDVAKASGKPAVALLLTHASREDAPLIEELRQLGVKRVYLSPATYETLTAIANPSIQEREAAAKPKAGYEIILTRQMLVIASGAGGRAGVIEFLPCDECATAGAATVSPAGREGALRRPARLSWAARAAAGTDTAVWREALGQVAVLHPAHVVPGFGSWG